MGLAVHPSGGPHPHPFAPTLEGVFDHRGRGTQASHWGACAFVKVVNAASAAVVLHHLVIVQTTSPILDDGFALAVRATAGRLAQGGSSFK